MSDDCRTNCPIANGGFCERHDLQKTIHFVQLCLTRDDYWRAWEEGRGPGQAMGRKSDDDIAANNRARMERERVKQRAKILSVGIAKELITLMPWIAKQGMQGCQNCLHLLESLNKNGSPWVLSNLNGLSEQLFRNAIKRSVQVTREECADALRGAVNRWNANRTSSISEDTQQPSHVQPMQEIVMRHLIYHICPLKSNAVWQWNLDQLSRRWSVFNGRKILALVNDENCHGQDVVTEYLLSRGCDGYELLVMRNDKRLREVVTFTELLRRVSSTSSSDAVFYAHTKANSTAGGAEAALAWAECMYSVLLDGVDVAMDTLRRHKAAGTTKLRWKEPTPINQFPSGLKHGEWMFAGTFFWFRCDCLCSHPRYLDVPDDRYGAEAWLSGLLSADEAKSLYQPWDELLYPISPYLKHFYDNCPPGNK